MPSLLLGFILLRPLSWPGEFSPKQLRLVLVGRQAVECTAASEGRANASRATAAAAMPEQSPPLSRDIWREAESRSQLYFLLTT